MLSRFRRGAVSLARGCLCASFVSTCVVVVVSGCLLLSPLQCFCVSGLLLRPRVLCARLFLFLCVLCSLFFACLWLPAVGVVAVARGVVLNLDFVTLCIGCLV